MTIDARELSQRIDVAAGKITDAAGKDPFVTGLTALVSEGISGAKPSSSAGISAAIAQAALGGGVLPLRSTPVRVGTLGDSTANIGTLSSPTSQDISLVTAPFPASGRTSLGLDSNKWLLGHIYPMAYPVANCGISGESSAQIVARDNLSATTTRRAISDLINLRPDVVLLRGGSINDLMGLSAGQVAAQVAASYANHVAIISRLLTSSAVVIDEGIYGFSNGTANTAADQAATRSALTQLNALFKAFAANSAGRVVFIDPIESGISDATGAYINGASTDGTHLGTYGQYLNAVSEAAILTKRFGPSAKVRYPGVNLIANSLMSATGSQAYGTVATGYIIGASNSTRQNAKVEIINGVPFQTCEYVGTSNPNSGSIYMPLSIATMGISANDQFGFEFSYLVQGVSSSILPTPTTSLACRLEVRKTSNGIVACDMLQPSQAGSIPIPGGWMGRCVFNPIQIPEASASIDLSNLFISFDTTELATYKLGVSEPRMVKLN